MVQGVGQLGGKHVPRLFVNDALLSAATGFGQQREALDKAGLGDQLVPWMLKTLRK